MKNRIAYIKSKEEWKMSKVSIIIPVYNNEKHIEKTVRSIMNQTYGNLEIIVIDDGSTDKSSDILQKLSAEDSRIVVIHQKNSGVSVARNVGIDRASGEYLTFVDGDDYIATDYVQKLHEFANVKEADLVICGVTYVDEKGKILKDLIPDEYQRFNKEEWTFRISGVWSHFYKTQLWKTHKIRFYPGERGEDMPISLYFSAMCDNIATLPEVGYYYVQHTQSAMHHFRGLNNFKLPYIALEKVIRKIQKTGIKNSSEYYELFVLRIFCTCYFDLSRGASKAKKRELCDYILRILKTYFPQYYKNSMTRFYSKYDAPFVQKMAVHILVILVRTKLIYPMSIFLR